MKLLVFVFLIFLTLKLAGLGQVAEWSWWWVTSPLWGPVACFIGLMVCVFIGGIAEGALLELDKKN